LSSEAVKQSLEAGTGMGDLAESRHVSLAQLHALELRTFQQVSKKAINVGDTTQEIVDDALRQFRREPETTWIAPSDAAYVVRERLGWSAR